MLVFLMLRSRHHSPDSHGGVDERETQDITVPPG
jgi:hypothetical protein